MNTQLRTVRTGRYAPDVVMSYISNGAIYRCFIYFRVPVHLSSVEEETQPSPMKTIFICTSVATKTFYPAANFTSLPPVLKSNPASQNIPKSDGMFDWNVFTLYINFKSLHYFSERIGFIIIHCHSAHIIPRLRQRDIVLALSVCLCVPASEFVGRLQVNTGRNKTKKEQHNWPATEK
jgi:hypothetical protein